MNTWGGKREGAGRKTGWRKESSEQRPGHQIRAFNDEWNLIKEFANLVKYGNREACEKFISQHTTK